MTTTYLQSLTTPGPAKDEEAVTRASAEAANRHLIVFILAFELYRQDYPYHHSLSFNVFSLPQPQPRHPLRLH